MTSRLHNPTKSALGKYGSRNTGSTTDRVYRSREGTMERSIYEGNRTHKFSKLSIEKPQPVKPSPRKSSTTKSADKKPLKLATRVMT